MKRGSVKSLALALALTLALAYVTAGLAGAEQNGRGGVVISFDGEISPNRIPRDRLVPIELTLRGAVRSSDGSSLPRLEGIEFAFGAPGGLKTRGLPVCPRARLRNATQRQALARCRAALVGHGTIAAEVPLNPDDPIRARASVLAFNGRAGGRPAVWAHAYASSPAVSFVLPFYLRRLREGAYGVEMSSPIGRSLGRWPRLRSFEITLGRSYGGSGERRSYLSARCPLPRRFDALAVPLARVTYSFSPRPPTISEVILRRCRVRE